MSNARYVINLDVNGLDYAASSRTSQKQQLVFNGKTLYNNNLLPFKADLSVEAKFKTAAVLDFGVNLVDTNFDKIANLTVTLTKNIYAGDNSGLVNIKKTYSFDHISSDTNLQRFIDWKSYSSTNNLSTNIDPAQCATAVQIFSTPGYDLQNFNAIGRITIFDTYDKIYLSGDELVYKISNFMPFRSYIDKPNSNIGKIELTGTMKVPLPITDNLYVENSCSGMSSISSGDSYDDLPILGNF